MADPGRRGGLRVAAVRIERVFTAIGGALVIVPKTRNLGLLVLGPIVINILCFHAFVVKGGFGGAHAFITVAALFLLWAERRAFAELVNRPADPAVAQ